MTRYIYYKCRVNVYRCNLRTIVLVYNYWIVNIFKLDLLKNNFPCITRSTLQIEKSDKLWLI